MPEKKTVNFAKQYPTQRPNSPVQREGPLAKWCIMYYVIYTVARQYMYTCGIVDGTRVGVTFRAIKACLVRQRRDRGKVTFADFRASCECGWVLPPCYILSIEILFINLERPWFPRIESSKILKINRPLLYWWRWWWNGGRASILTKWVSGSSISEHQSGVIWTQAQLSCKRSLPFSQGGLRQMGRNIDAPRNQDSKIGSYHS